MTLLGEEAQHAVRVKRVEAGESVEVLDGRGNVGEGEVIETGKRGREFVMSIRLSRVRQAEAIRPRVVVLSATPKGSRVDELIDQLSQAGAAEWSPLETERAVVDPRETKLHRLERVAREASKQCGRAWAMTIGPKHPLARALQADGRTLVVVADAAGEPFSRGVLADRAEVRLLVGPEGGFTGAEIEQARKAGAAVVSFGPHAMRIETAAVVGTGTIMATAGRG